MTPTLESIWNEFAVKLRQFIRSRVSDAATAEDILQDVFVKIQARLGQLEDPAKMESWLYHITRNAVIDFYRQRAEAAGLASVMAMNTGDARAYGAAAEDGSGKLLRVVATPVEDGPTSVQLDWTAGR